MDTRVRFIETSFLIKLRSNAIFRCQLLLSFCGPGSSLPVCLNSPIRDLPAAMSCQTRAAVNRRGETACSSPCRERSAPSWLRDPLARSGRTRHPPSRQPRITPTHISTSTMILPLRILLVINAPCLHLAKARPNAGADVRYFWAF